MKVGDTSLLVGQKTTLHGWFAAPVEYLGMLDGNKMVFYLGIDHATLFSEGFHYFDVTYRFTENRIGNSYKAGVIRLGFYIKSDRARLLRDWVENLVLAYTENKIGTLPQTPKRKHNRLTSERLLSIMADVCRIEDAELRISISTKLMQGGAL